jgi:hypothetical protein
MSLGSDAEALVDIFRQCMMVLKGLSSDRFHRSNIEVVGEILEFYRATSQLYTVGIDMQNNCFC